MIELDVNGMTCGHCASTVTSAIKSLDPGANVRVDLDHKRVSVEGRSSAEDLARTITAAGYPAVPAGPAASAASAKGGGCC